MATDVTRRDRASGITRLVAAVLLLLALVSGASGSDLKPLEWGLLRAGESTVESVRARYGAPTRSTQANVDGYDTLQWVYEGRNAPAGFLRLTVDFGLQGPAGYRRDLVRSFMLEPKPGLFTRQTVVDAYGAPTGVGQQGGFPAFLYEEGLFVYFERDGWTVLSMVFTPRQRIEPQPPPPR